MDVIETERLVLRRFEVTDWPALKRSVLPYAESPLGRYDHQWPTDDDGLRDAAAWFAGGDAYRAVCRKSDGAFVGLVTLNPTATADERDLGVLFDPEFHGHGFAREACRAYIDHVIHHHGVTRIVSGTAVANERSVRLLRSLGMKVIEEGTGSFCDDEHGRPIVFDGYFFELIPATDGLNAPLIVERSP